VEDERRRELLAELEHLQHRSAEIETELHLAAPGVAAPPEAADRLDFTQSLRQIANAGVLKSDSQGRCLDVNDHFCRITGLARDQILGRRWMLGSQPRPESTVERIEPGRAYRGESRYRRPDGRVIRLQMDSIAETDVERRPTGNALTTIVDVTARKEAEEVARRSQDLLLSQLRELLALYRHAPVGLTFVDRDLRFRHINERLAALSGRPVADHVGAPVREIIPEIADQMLPSIERVIATGEAVLDRVVEIKLPSDPHARHTFLVNCHPVAAPDGSVEGVIGVLSDITLIRRTSEELRAVKERLAEAQELAGVGSWEWDLIEDRLWWSDHLYHIMGRQKGRFQPTYDAFFELVHPEDRATVRKQIDATLERGDPYRVQFRVIRSDGSVRLIRAAARLERAPGGLPLRLAGTCHDMTEQQAAERARGLR
jgi:PAS domain S-box-containing protein